MKKLIFSILLLSISCSSNSNILVKKIKDPMLAQLLIFSELKDLNKLQPNIEKKLWVKVYKLPNTEPNNCFPESHGICNYKYYLATSQLDDSPIINAYDLGILGEIVEYKWKKTNTIDKVVINIKANKYSKEALNYNKSLINITINYQIIATPNNLVLTKINK